LRGTAGMFHVPAGGLACRPARASAISLGPGKFGG